MSSDRPHGSNSSAENLLGEGATQDQTGLSGYMNHAGPNSVPSSPPPSYQHVLEETRLAALTEHRTPSKSHRHKISKQASADSVSQDSDHSSPHSRSRLSRRSNTVSSNDSPNTNADDTNDRHIARGESWQDFGDFTQKDHTDGAGQAWQEFNEDGAGGKENFGSQNADSWRDYQKPSTSYDANSRQFGETNDDTREMGQCERDSEEEVDVYETITESDLEDERRQAEYECKMRAKQPVPEGYIEVANKTSKAMYLAMAKEMGIVCRMSDQCRCLDCQGGYLDCGDGDTDENIKTDGGLGAGTPMFVSEVFGHGIAPACAIL